MTRAPQPGTCPAILETLGIPCERPLAKGSDRCRWHHKKKTGHSLPPPLCSCGCGRVIQIKYGRCRNCQTRAMRALNAPRLQQEATR